MNDPRLLLLSEKDNVLIVCRPIGAGETIMISGIERIVENAVALGHKLARFPIIEGENILKYGVPIGSATQAIRAGEHVHIHNLTSNYTKTHVIAGTVP